MKRLILAGVLSASVSSAFAAKDKLQEFHALCNPHADTPLSTEIPCVKALVNASHDPIYNATDPATQIYLIDADKLLANVEKKRISETEAREKLLRMLLALQDRHRPELAAQDNREYMAEQQRIEQEAAEGQARLEAEREERIAKRQQAEQSQRQAQANADAAQQRENAVSYCIGQVVTKNQAYAAAQKSPGAATAGQQLGMLLSGNTPRSLCEQNPQFYQTMPAAPVVTKCQRNGFGQNVQVTCATN